MKVRKQQNNFDYTTNYLLIRYKAINLLSTIEMRNMWEIEKKTHDDFNRAK